MNRKSVTAVLLVVSIIINIAFLVFAYIQKYRADDLRQEVLNLTREVLTIQRETKAELDECEGLRAQCDEAREQCEQKVLAISNRK
jgi:hypothetical protein